jgi:AcrR family transcriptional regulator
MGNREALMAAAKRCLTERGYSHTSARDIASEAGVSTAAIGYHYGTKDALLMEALLEALEEWGAALGEKMVASSAPGSTPAERFTENWARVIETFGTDRELWRIQFDMLGAMDRNPRLKEILSGANREARLALVAMFGDPRGADAPDDDEAERIGSFYQALLAGLSAQHLLDPATSLTGPELARMLTEVAGLLG